MSDDYARKITNQAVARVAVALDYKYASDSVIETLSDVVKTYIENLGERLRDQAENSGRVHPGLRDAIGALPEMVFYFLNHSFI